MRAKIFALLIGVVLIGCISPSLIHGENNNQSNSENWFTNGQPADLILGPLGFEKSGGPSFLHHPGSVETDGTRLFVADTRNNRVLIWNSIPTTNYAPADVVIGQPDFESASTRCGQRGLAWPMSVATDGQRLFVADTNNHRVLIWNSIPTANYQPADIVLGQPDFESCNEPMEASPTTLSWPWSVETDGRRLYVADTAHARVLIWNTIPTRNNQPADVVIGMPDLWSKPGLENVNAWIEANPRATLVGRGGPRGICTDGKRLAISTYGGPLKIWNSIPTKNGQPADVVLEDYKAEIEPETDGTRLFITSEQAVLIWNSWPTQDNQPPDIVVGDRWFPGLSRDRMCGPRSVATDGRRLIVADTFGNSRVLIWNQIPSENGLTPADVVLGQVDFSTNAFISRVGFKAGEGICTDGTHLFAYSAEGRLLIWKSLPEENNAPADVVLGWPDFTPPPSPRWWDECREKMGTEWIFRRTLSYGGIFSDGQHLFVVDRVRNRVLIWNMIPTMNFAPADVVLGQPNFNGEESTLPHAGRSGLNNPYDVASDGKHLFVTDSGNNRVLIWNSIPTENGQPADVVIGQPDFNTTTPGGGRAGLYMPDSVATDGKRLYVGEREGRRVLVWNSIPTKNGQPADLVLGQISFEAVLGEPGTIPEPASNMCPRGIATDGAHLFIVDQDHNRVLVWNSLPTRICQPADVVLGAPDLESIMYARRASINQDRLFTPVDVAFDGQHLWVSEMKWSNRLVRFSIPKPRAVVLRTPINIKANSMTLTWSPGTLENFVKYEVHGSTEPGFTPSTETLLATITDPKITSYTVSNLSPGTTYWFKVRTCYADGGYGDSVQRWATTKAPTRSGEWMERETSHFKIYYHAGYEQQANSLLEAHENIYEFVTGFIGYAPPMKTEIYLCSTPEEWADIGNAPYIPEEGSSAGQWSNGVLSYYNTFGGSGVIHEFVHAVESQLLEFKRPTWWTEGLACYLTYKFTGKPGPGGLYPDQLSDFTGSILKNNPPFKTLGELEAEVALTKFGYEESTSVFLFIDENYGESKINEIIRAADTTENVQAAFQAVLGVSFQAFETSWRNCLTKSIVAIAEAQSAVGIAERDGRTHGLNEAKARLSEARGSFNLGRFSEAWAKASEACTLAESATREGAPWAWVGVGIAIVVIIAAVVLVSIRKVKMNLKLRPLSKEEDTRSQSSW